MRESQMEFETLWAYLIANFKCDLQSFHGPHHWRRVASVAVEIGKR